MSRFQRVLRTLRFMVEPWHPPKRPTFITDELLELRIAAARDLIGDREPKADRERQPVDYERGLPIG